MLISTSLYLYFYFCFSSIFKWTCAINKYEIYLILFFWQYFQFKKYIIYSSY